MTRRLPLFVAAALLLAAGSVRAATPRLAASLLVTFDTDTHIVNFPLAGKIHITAEKSTAQTTLKTAGWKLALLDDGKLYETVTDIQFDAALPDEMEAGKTYDIPFHIIFSKDLAKLIQGRWDSGQVSVPVINIFFAGGHVLRAALVSTEKMDPPIESSPANFQVTPGYSAAIGAGTVMSVFPRADGDIRRRMLETFIPNGTLAEADVLSLLENADPVEKGRISELYAARHFDLAKLHFFQTEAKTAGQSRLLPVDPEAKRPFFMAYDVSETVLILGDPRSGHHEFTARVGKESFAARDGDFNGNIRLPATPGVYPVTDDTGAHTWGWILVRAAVGQ